MRSAKSDSRVVNPHISPGGPANFEIVFIDNPLTDQCACCVEYTLSYPVFATIWLCSLHHPPGTIATAMLRRTIAQSALPDCRKIPDPGEVCGLNPRLRRSRFAFSHSLYPNRTNAGGSKRASEIFTFLGFY